MDGEHEQKLPIGVAAARLGLTTAAVRKRIRRGSLRAEKAPDGTWLISLPPGVVQDADHGPTAPVQGPGPDVGAHVQDAGRDELVVQLRRENERLWRELERRNLEWREERESRSEELRRKDFMLAEFARSIAELKSRLPELPSATHEVAESEVVAATRPSWWRRLLWGPAA